MPTSFGSMFHYLSYKKVRKSIIESINEGKNLDNKYKKIKELFNYKNNFENEPPNNVTLRAQNFVILKKILKSKEEVNNSNSKQQINFKEEVNKFDKSFDLEKIVGKAKNEGKSNAFNEFENSIHPKQIHTNFKEKNIEVKILLII